MRGIKGSNKWVLVYQRVGTELGSLLQAKSILRCVSWLFRKSQAKIESCLCEETGVRKLRPSKRELPRKKEKGKKALNFP